MEVNEGLQLDSRLNSDDPDPFFGGCAARIIACPRCMYYYPHIRRYSTKQFYMQFELQVFNQITH